MCFSIPSPFQKRATRERMQHNETCRVCGNPRIRGLACRPCAAARTRAWWIKNKERLQSERVTCKKCGTERKASSKCGPCLREYKQAWYQKNIDRLIMKSRARYAVCDKSVVRDQDLRKNYNITLLDALSMLDRQLFCCAICNKILDISMNWKNAHVDHCHRCDNVRRILCVQCNHGLGKFCDDLVIVRAAANYLDQHVADCNPNQLEFSFMVDPYAIPKEAN